MAEFRQRFFARFHAYFGKLPHAGHALRVSRTLHQSYRTPFAGKHVVNLLALASGLRRRRVGTAGCAPRDQRTNQALRRTWGAEGGAQFHHRLVEVAGTRAIEQRFSALPVPFSADGGAEQAVQYSLDVAVHDGDGFTKCNTRNSPRGEAPEPGQSAPAVRRSRKFSLPFARDHLRCLVQSARPMVVAKPAPQSENGLLPCCRERPHVRKAFHPARVVVEHGGHPRLLQHDFGNPDGIWVPFSPTIAKTGQLWATHVFAPPWQVPSIWVVTAERGFVGS